MLDPSRVGIAGHSLGAGGVSYVGQRDPRVKAIVAWDNLRGPGPAPRHLPVGLRPSAPTRTAAKPALGMSADYGLTPTPYTSDPDRARKSDAAALQLAAAGVDTGELIIRGGTHYEFGFIPNPGFGGTLRGEDLVAWYTTAWFDNYVKGDRRATARLLTDRWRNDAARPPSTPTTTATCSRSTTARGCGSTGARARTCARLRAARSPPTGWARSRRSEQRASGDGGDGRTRPMSPRCS